MANENIEFQNIIDDCDWYNENNEHYDYVVFLNVKNYIKSPRFTVNIYNSLTDIEKLYCLEFMENSEKFIEFAFKNQGSANILPKITLDFISKIDKQLLKQFVNSEEFTINIFKVLDKDVKIYIILFFNSTKATEYLFRRTDDITNFKQLYDEYEVSTDDYKQCPKDTIYKYYPFLIVRALKASKRFLDSIKKSTRPISFLQTKDSILDIKIIIKKMLAIHEKPIKYVPGLHPFLSVMKQLEKGKKYDETDILVLSKDNFNTIGQALYKNFNSVLATPTLFTKLKELLVVINDYQDKDTAKFVLNDIEQKINLAYKQHKLTVIPEKATAGNMAGYMEINNQYYEFFARRTFITYKIIDEAYNNAAIIIPQNSKSSKSNFHYQNLLVTAKFDKSSVDPNHLRSRGRQNAINPSSNR